MKLLHLAAAFAAVAGGVKASPVAQGTSLGVAQILAADDAACPAPSTVTVTKGKGSSPQKTEAPKEHGKAVTETDTETLTEYITVNGDDDDEPGTTRTTTTTTQQVTVTKGSPKGGKGKSPGKAAPTACNAPAPETTITRTLYEIHTLESQCAVPVQGGGNPLCLLYTSDAADE